MSDGEPRTVLALALRVRDLVNAPRRHGALRADPPGFARVCAAMDVLEDADGCLREYLALPAAARIGYLQLYGVMQALYVQQDAVRHLLADLNLDGWPELDEEPRLKEPRDTRDEATGHPVSRRGKAGATSSYQVSRQSMRREGFQLLGQDHATGQRAFRDVNTLKLMAGQAECLGEVLAAAVKQLEEEVRMHRRAFRGEQLSPVLPTNFPYLAQKIGDAAAGPQPENTIPAQAAIEALRSGVSNLADALRGRGLGAEALPGGWPELREVVEILDSVECRLEPGSSRSADPDRATILRAYAHRLATLGDVLTEITAELDAEYASDDVDSI